ncbi:hypothetical protein C8046_06695 [Serinibacter arcticus]|uniref:Uncharacterized protein n=1 Tax=Serinibacter arcticus TaxID=1655435 RepID=A0A2U1ZTS3_9MICO|nr:hypothetical protein [Serinibacter arcticus]PWD50385.1 hypothetical protein C8046_06695 [Serinibacter arcticus]
MEFATLLGLVLGVLGLAALANGVVALWRSSPSRRYRAVVASVVPQATFLVLHLDVPTPGGDVRVPARTTLADPDVEIGAEREVVLDALRKIAWIGAAPRSLRILGVVSVVLGTVLLVVAAGLVGVGARV